LRARAEPRKYLARGSRTAAFIANEHSREAQRSEKRDPLFSKRPPLGQARELESYRGRAWWRRIHRLGKRTGGSKTTRGEGAKCLQRPCCRGTTSSSSASAADSQPLSGLKKRSTSNDVWGLVRSKVEKRGEVLLFTGPTGGVSKNTGVLRGYRARREVYARCRRSESGGPRYRN